LELSRSDQAGRALTTYHQLRREPTATAVAAKVGTCPPAGPLRFTSRVTWSTGWISQAAWVWAAKQITAPILPPRGAGNLRPLRRTC